MKRTKWIPVILALTLLVGMMAACSKDTPTATLETPVPSASTTVTPSPSPTALVSTTPEAEETANPAAATPMPGGAVDEEIGETFKALAKLNDAVLRGTIVKKLDGYWNSVRSGADPEKGDPDYKMNEVQYEFKITEVYQNGTKKSLKVGDTITINQAHSEQLGSKAKVTNNKNYVELAKGAELVVFLERDGETVPSKVQWLLTSVPSIFTVKDGNLIVTIGDKKVEATWLKKAAAGIPIANLKKDLGIK